MRKPSRERRGATRYFSPTHPLRPGSLGSAIALSFILALAACSARSNASRTLDPPVEPVRGTLRTAEPDWTPVLAVSHANPWTPGVGSLPPTFVLYADGTVIKPDGWQAYATLLRRRLTEAELVELLRAVDFASLEPYASKGFSTTSATDQPGDVVYWRRADGSYASVAVTGWSADPNLRGFNYTPPPRPIDDALRTLSSFDMTGAEPWLPDEVEVHFWAEGPVTEEAMKWPEDWPRPKPSRAWSDGELDSVVRIDKNQFLSIENAMREGSSEFYGDRITTIHVGHRQWQASVRFPLPNERVWRPETSLPADR